MQITTKTGRLGVRYLKTIAVARGDPGAAAAYAASQAWPESRQITDLLQRAAVGAMTSTSDPGLADPIGNDLAALAVPYSVVLQLRSRFRLVPPRTAVVSQTAGASAFWGDPYQAGGKAIPVQSLAFSRFTGLFEKRISAIAVVSDELAQSATPEAEATISADIGRAIGAAVDAAFLNPYQSGSPAEAPASVTASGRIFSAGAGVVDTIDANLEQCITALYDGGSDLANATWCMNTLTATRLSRMRGSGGNPAYPGVSVRGGVLMGLPVLVTANIPRSGSPSPGATTLSLVDPARIWYTDRDPVEMQTSRYAVLEMDNAPSADASSATAASAVSLWQTNSTALKLVKWVAWQPVAGTSHAASLVNVEW